MTAGFALVVGVTGCGGGGSATPLATGGLAPSTGAASGQASGGTASGPASGSGSGEASGRPSVLVAVTSGKDTLRDSGAVVVLDPVTGMQRRTLVPTLAVGDAVQVSPDGATVYYEKVAGCYDEIWSVPVAGGTPRFITAGSKPALSPDGSKLAYSTNITGDSCAGNGSDATNLAVIVRNLRSGTEQRFPLAKDQLQLPSPVGHLSWNGDGTLLAVSIDSPQDNEGWGLRVINPATDHYYLGQSGAGTDVPPNGTGVPATARQTFLRQGVFLPDGRLFVVHRCCWGWPPKTTLEHLDIVEGGTGAVARQVAVGVTTKDHTSLDADASGRWLLYLSGSTVMVSDGGATPTVLTSTGYQAVDW
jgi:hypothetical protein